MERHTITVQHAGRTFTVAISERTLGISYTDGTGRRQTGWGYWISEDGVDCYGGPIWPLPSREACELDALLWIRQNRRPRRKGVNDDTDN